MWTIDRINYTVAQWTVTGWFLGLAYFNWFSSTGPKLPMWVQLALAVGGLFASSILIGGGIAALAAVATRVATGRSDGSPVGFMLAGWVSPLLAFFAAKYAVLLAAQI